MPIRNKLMKKNDIHIWTVTKQAMSILGPRKQHNSGHVQIKELTYKIGCKKPTEQSHQ